MTARFRPLLIALGTLTTFRVPVSGDVTRSTLAASTAVYPLVGAAIGVLVGGMLYLPLPHMVRAVGALVVWVVATRALHLDGWADCCDAAFAPIRDAQDDPHAQGLGQQHPQQHPPQHPPQFAQRHAILKDPHIGTFGVTGLILLLLAKWTTLTSVTPVAPVIAAAVARFGMVLVIGRFRAARTTGLLAAFDGAVSWKGSMFALLLVVVSACMVYPRTTYLIVGSVVLGLAAAYGLASFLSRRFGGVAGDVCGAAAEFSELAILVAFVSWNA